MELFSVVRLVDSSIIHPTETRKDIFEFATEDLVTDIHREWDYFSTH